MNPVAEIAAFASILITLVVGIWRMSSQFTTVASGLSELRTDTTDLKVKIDKLDDKTNDVNQRLARVEGTSDNRHYRRTAGE